MADKFPDPKVGDPVAYYSSHHATRPTARLVIEKVTATQVVTNSGRFKRSNGRPVSADRWSSSYSEPWDADLDARLAELAAEENRAARSVTLLKRIATAARGLEVKRDRYWSGPRKWSALELERLHALVLTFEDGAAALKATLEPDFVPGSES